MRRTLILVALAAGTLGGMIGALATAATQSEATPAAIAAAVARVQDQKAESLLSAINARTKQLNSSLNGTNGSIVYQLERSLQLICEHTDTDGLAGVLDCPGPALQTFDTTARAGR